MEQGKTELFSGLQLDEQQLDEQTELESQVKQS